jgi:hypothetical protein
MASAAPSTAGNRGGLKAWTNEEQKRWLTEKLPAYRTSRASSHPGEFWPPVYEEWFEEWPMTVNEGETGNKAEILAQLMAKRKEVSSRCHNRAEVLTSAPVRSSKSDIGSRITRVRRRLLGRVEVASWILLGSPPRPESCLARTRTPSCILQRESSLFWRRGGGRNT